MQVLERQRELAPTPGEQYLKALWRGRWLFLAIVAAFVGGSLIVTALLPKSFSSNAILSIRPTPPLEPAAPLYGSAIVGERNASNDTIEQIGRASCRERV